jgi:hypothetical protein
MKSDFEAINELGASQPVLKVIGLGGAAATQLSA